jgi:adenylate cyclase
MGGTAPQEEPDPALALPLRQKVVLVMDLVESVRLMAASEAAVVGHWRGFVRHATDDVLPRHGGRLVKSLGDGILVEFDVPRRAAAAALELQRYFDAVNVTLPEDARYYLRAGLNTSRVYVDDIDIYGSGVNLAARIATLAGPGETVATAEVRDGLTEGVDAVVEDLGECYLKHVAHPVRAFRIGAAGARPVLSRHDDAPAPRQPVVAVIPFSARTQGPEHLAVGELIADGVIAHLGKTRELKVISRLATTALRDRNLTVADVGSQLQAEYIVSGSYIVVGSRLVVTAELVEASSGDVLWVERIPGDIADLLEPASQMCLAIAEAVHANLLGRAVEQAMYRPVPTLAGQTLMFAGIAGVHHVGRDGFRFSGKALSAVLDRHPRHAEAYAWLAKWHAIGANRGLQGPESTKIAADFANRAVQSLPDSPFALTISGLVQAFFLQDLDAADKCYARALALNPNEPLAWLYTGTLRAWQGRGAEAAHAARRALELAPIGTAQYYVQSLAGLALLCAGEHDDAIAVLRHSQRLNASHSSTYRALAMALTLSGRVEEARAVVRDLLVLEPGFTVKVFLQRYGGRAHPHAIELAAALAEAGVPGG